MLPFIVCAGLLAAPQKSSDEYVYLYSKFDIDGFAPRGQRDGDFDTQGRTFPSDLLKGEGRKLEIESKRYGRTVFLRPKTGAGDKNMMSIDGQTIGIRTSKKFNVLLWLGASIEPQHGYVRLRFADGSSARAPIGFSSWAADAAYGEDVALEGSLDNAAPRAVRGGTVLRVAPGGVQAGRVRLWIQRTPIPADRVLKSVELPKLAGARIVALTLANRAGITWRESRRAPTPPAAPVAIFRAAGFPSHADASMTPESLKSALQAAGIESVFLDADHVGDLKVLTAERHPVVVWPYQGGFPRSAIAAIRAYRKNGGAMVHVAAPFSESFDLSPYGGWIDRGATSSYQIGQPQSVGVLPYVTVSRTRIWPTDTFKEWGIGEVDWDSVEFMNAHGIPTSYAGVDTRVSHEGVELIPLLRVGAWSTCPAAIVRHRGGDFKGCLDVFAFSLFPWVEGRPSLELATALITRSAAWCLKERGKIDEESWKRISAPLKLRATSAVARAQGSDRPLAVLHDAPEGTTGPQALRIVDASSLSEEERVLLASVQGVAHRRATKSADAPRIAIAVNSVEQARLKRVATRGAFSELKTISLEGALETIGATAAVVVDPDLIGSLNLATVVAASDGLLVAYPNLVGKYSLDVTFDLRGVFKSQSAMLEWSISNLAPRLRPDRFVVLESRARDWHLRDYAIAHRVFVITAPDWSASSATSSYPAAIRSARSVLDRAPLLSTVIGSVPQQFDPKVWPVWETSSRSGHRFVNAGSIANLSLHSLRGQHGPVKAQPAVEEKIERKIYIGVASTPISMDQVRYSQRFAAPAAVRGSSPDLELGDDDDDFDALFEGKPPTTTRAPVSLSVELATADLAGNLIDDYLRDHSGAASGVHLGFDLATFARGFGSRRKEQIAALATHVNREATARGLRFITMPTGDRESLDALAAGVDDRLAMLVAGGRRNESPVTATRVVGGNAVFEDMGAAALANLAKAESADVYRPLYPLFLGTHQFPPTGSQTAIGDHVVVTDFETVARMARQAHAKWETTASELLPAGADWRYHDGGRDFGTRWRSREFDDSAWKKGAAELGYGDEGDGRPEATVLSFGDDSANKHQCYYFRHTLKLDEKPRFDLLLVEALADDGCVIYVNGVERARYNMPDGEISFATSASTAYGGSSETEWFRAAVPANALQEGENVIAVEVHQAGKSSSDLSFDFRMTGFRRVPRQPEKNE